MSEQNTKKLNEGGRKLTLLIAVAINTVLAAICASHLYYRGGLSTVSGLLTIAVGVLGVVLRQTEAKSGKVFAVLFTITGVAAFFGSTQRRAKMMQFALMAAVVVGAIYLIATLVRAIRRKLGKVEIVTSVLCVVVIAACLGVFGNRMITNVVTSSGAEAYDNSIDFGVTGQWITIPGRDGTEIRAIVNRPRYTLEKGLPAVVFTHGGSWIGGTAMDYDGYCQKLADDLGAVVINVDYRLLFDKTFPSPVYEAVDTVHYLYDHADEYVVDKDKIFVHGESAGGHIAACAAVVLTEEDFPLRGAMYHYPFSTFTERPENEEMASGFDMLTAAYAKGVDLKVPELSPGAAPAEILAKHCPVFLEVGTADILQDQGEILAKHYKECGVDITVCRLEGATHGFVPEDPADREQLVLQKSLEDQCRAELIKFVEEQLAK